MDMHDAQQKHIEQSLSDEQIIMDDNRPMAEIAIRVLLEKITADYLRDDGWTQATLIHWSRTDRLVSLAVSGRADGYFNTPYPPLSEMVKALFE